MPVEFDEVSGQNTTGHEWDGIKELSTPIPKVTLWAYGLSIVVALTGWLLYPSIPLGDDFFRGVTGANSRESVLREVDQASRHRSESEQPVIEFDYAQLLADPSVRRNQETAAAVLFEDNCAACHGRDLKGQIGFPNLLDQAWLFDGSPEEIEQTIRFGINDTHDETRYGEMPAFGRDEMLASDEIDVLVEYVLSVSGQPHDTKLAVGGPELYAENCSGCHGENAEGIGIGAPNLRDSTWIYGGTREAIVRTIYDGRAGVMPNWDGRLSDAEIRKLVLYLKWSGEDGEVQD